ncbi:hypothetical protein G7B40_003000 [Aetokthonos hydrillicola Thurmond2011]|uniref:Uncharacterized protein n=1 Tax=Aetokthonos hydrillicola Thurmond2011 TaxID=2712845 RepID=A0AAP5M8G1_9CYAN|nr:hypothetical protein [Aetokthonos hydrillicola]MBO3459357.1 hypothetical protein [Aetokthonos hydrillicola CCALA 1050]MBW4586503.1 hypothetical protein [Aetokthonos hydrillicola CCALA 1050]MDR9893553.1 hypothetical protein [Aetokthonos hydrillicola Thurmond2011]
MQHLHKLLAKKDSAIAWFLRSRFQEIEAFLKEAPAILSQDPGAEICCEVLQELESLLQLSSFDSATNQSQNIVVSAKEDSFLEDTQSITSPPSSLPDSTFTNELKLSHLRDAFNSDKDLIKYLGDFQLRSQTDPELWNEIQHKLLRLPKEMAKSWRERASELAKEAEAEIDESNILQLHFTDNQDIYPGLKGTIQAKGLSLSNNVPLDSQILQENEYARLSEDLKLLASLVSICISSINIEPDLHHALETVYKFDTMPLDSNPEQRHKYIETLKERFLRTLKAEECGEPVTVLKAWINVDEAIHSLVFVPPADSDSSSSELQKRTRRILIEKVKKVKDKGHDVRIQELSGVYADIHKLSSDYDLPLKVGGIPGEVQACLRVYARIDKEVFPGRVIYRSLK